MFTKTLRGSESTALLSVTPDQYYYTAVFMKYLKSQFVTERVFVTDGFSI